MGGFIRASKRKENKERMLDRPIVLDEKRGISITLGVLVHFVLTILIVGMGYATIRNDLANVIVQSARNETQLQITRELLDTLLDFAGEGIEEITEAQRAALEAVVA